MPYKIEYIRRIYGIANLMSECGGFLKALTICCFIINYPISRHLFYVHIIKQLFFARTSDENLMKPAPKLLSENEKRRVKYLQHNKIPKELQNPAFLHEVKKHRLIKITKSEKILMFIHVYLPCLSRLFKWHKRDQLVKLYNLGKKKIDRNLNVIRLV